MTKRWAAASAAEKAALGIAALVLGGHVLASVLGPYGVFRDELYFIDCGRHPSFGYVDQPPLVPLLAAASVLFGRTLFFLRALPALAHAGTVVVAAALAARVARSLGEREDVARLVAAGSAALAPMYLGLHSTLNTTSFEPLAWTFIAYAAARATLGGERRWLVWLGIAAGVAMEAKYAAPFFLVPLVAGLVLGPSRRVLWTREASAGVAAAVAIALPSVAWQAGHGLPFRELLHAASHGKNTVVPPGPFLLNQVLVMNPVLAPLWIGGVGWALVARRLAPVRFLAIAFVGVLLEMILLHGKDYYAAPAYGVAFALGGLFAARLVRARGAIALGAYFALAVALTVIAIPTSMPVMPPADLARYVVATHTQPQAQENNQRDAVIPQLMADMLGWRELESTVAGVWRALPPDERARTTIVTGNYGDAGALDLYGPDDGLPPARSGHNQYFLWGPGEDDPKVILRVGGDPERWKDRCDELTIPARYGGPYVMPYERDRPVLQCRGPRFSLRAEWSDFKHYE